MGESGRKLPFHVGRLARPRRHLADPEKDRGENGRGGESGAPWSPQITAKPGSTTLSPFGGDWGDACKQRGRRDLLGRGMNGVLAANVPGGTAVGYGYWRGHAEDRSQPGRGACP